MIAYYRCTDAECSAVTEVREWPATRTDPADSTWGDGCADCGAELCDEPLADDDAGVPEPEAQRRNLAEQRANLAEQRANLAEDAELSSLCPEERASYRPPPWRRPRADRLGEPTGDPTACELGDHVDVEGGKCLLCGEWVIGS